MIRICIRKPLYSYERLVFPDKMVDSSADIVRYMRFDKNCLEGLRLDEKEETLVNDLSKTEEELFAGYDKKVRNEIRRAEKEEITFHFWSANDLNKQNIDIDSIIKKYYEFCEGIKQPKLKKNLNKLEFDEYIQNDNVAISKAEYGDGWVYHIYLYDSSIAMLWFSFSDYRNLEGKNQIAGWANRALHHKDMMAFKNIGLDRYEWGGIKSSSAPNGIDKFKMNFGGQLTEVYYDSVANTFKGKMLIWIKRILK